MVATWDELSDLANPVFRVLVELNPHAHYPTGSNWVSEGSNTYSRVCKEVKVTASTDDGQELTEKLSVAEVKAAVGSWWFDRANQTIYVHCFDNDDLSSPSTDITVVAFVWKMFSTDAFEIPIEMDGLRGYWDFGKGSGMVAYDKSKYGNDGTLYPTPVSISPCDATDDWSGVALSIDTGDKKEGIGSLKDYVASPVATNNYVSIYNPSGSWDWSAKKHILFWLKSDRPSTAFTYTRLYLWDTSSKVRRWDLTFPAGEWTAIKLLLSAPDGSSDPPADLSLIGDVRIAFTAADTTPFYKKIDDLRIDDRPQWVDGKVGKALDFDNVDDYVKLPDSSVFTTVNDFTVMAWIYRKAYSTAWKNIVGFGGSGDEFQFAIRVQKITFYSSDLSPNSKTGNTDVSQDEWHHVVFVRSGANWAVYLDGEPDGGGVWVATQINIGGTFRGIGGDTGTEWFNGLIDEVRIFNRALNAEEIKALYNLSSFKCIPCMPIVRQDSLPTLGLSVDDLVEGMYRFNFGSFRMNNTGWFDAAAEEYIWTNCKVLIKLGGEDLPYSEYIVYFVGRVSDYSVKDEEVTFTVKDVRVGTYAQLPIDHYWVSNYPKLQSGAEGWGIPIFYGIKTNIIPVCIDSNKVSPPYGEPPYPTGSKWKIAGSRKIKEFTEIRLNFGDIDYSVPLVENTHYTTDLNNAEFTLLIPLVEGDTLEVDAKGYVVNGGVLMEKGGTIAKDFLKTYLGFVDDDLDLPSFSDVDTERPYELCIYLDVDKSSRQVLQTIGRSVIAFFTPVENGKLAFEVYKSTVPADTLELFDRDFGADWEVNLIDFFLRNKVKLRYNQNPKTQEFESVEKTNYDVLYKYNVRETLILETYLREASDAAVIAQAVQNMCSSPIKVVKTSCGVKAFKLFPTRKVKITRERAVDSSGAWDSKVFRVREVVKDVNTEQTQLIVADDFQLLGDVPHVNTPHTDVGHSDTSHVDTPHDNAGHTDTPYTHTPHTNEGHYDEPHEDLWNDEHEDSPHEDIEYTHIPHTDAGHTNTSHTNTPYSHTPHSDTPYSDIPHGDTPHIQT